jgi:Protein of unknown function (DUF3363)
VVSEQSEQVRPELSERGDIIKAINRALTERDEEWVHCIYALHGDEAPTPIVGRVIGKRLTDEFGELIRLVVDGVDSVDGHVHHVAAGEAMAVDKAKIGAIVEVDGAPSLRPADRNIAIVAHGTSEYSPSVYREILEAASSRVRGGDYDVFIDIHVRRPEASHRAGIVERTSAVRWIIPEDFEARAAAYDASRGRQTSTRVLSSYDLDQQVANDGATWLDRRPAATSARSPRVDSAPGCARPSTGAPTNLSGRAMHGVNRH